MEGRTIVRPDKRAREYTEVPKVPFNGGPDNRPARLSFAIAVLAIGVRLQWRAGQSSGQTRLCRPVSATAGCLQWRAGQSSGQTMNVYTDHDREVCPSMEGRTIVRPDWSGSPHARSCRTPFNGGPDNRPARPGAPQLRQRSWQRPLQWRAGQSSGQTRSLWRGVGQRRVPSMEGRTIVRPDSHSATTPTSWHGPFNGGPDNRPARRRRPTRQTRRHVPFNGGPDNRPARRATLCGRRQTASAFNGGPDNRPARPRGMV